MLDRITKICPNCEISKPLDAFHRSAKGRFGRASWCKRCTNGALRIERKRTYSSAQKRRWSLKSRYGLTTEAFDALVLKQNGQCGLCPAQPKQLYVDHCHITKKVRGLLCHRCNLLIGGLDDPVRRAKAMAWLENAG